MQTGYFKQSWHAMTSEKGWGKQVLLLALVQFIPIFGQIVLYGYFYNWAKDAAWGVESSFPKRKLFSEKNLLIGLYAWAIVFIWTFVFAFASQIVSMLSVAVENIPLLGYLVFAILQIAIIVIAIIWGMMAQVAAMRATIYNSFSPCVQIKPVWVMFKKDWKGQLKIFGISLLILIPTIILCLLFCGIVIALAGSTIVGLATAAASGTGSTDTISRLATSLLSAIPVLLLVGLVFTYIFLVLEVFVTGLVVRSIGIWCSHFDVPHWKGQNDPLPFETAGPDAAAAVVYPVAPDETPAQDTPDSPSAVSPEASAENSSADETTSSDATKNDGD